MGTGARRNESGIDGLQFDEGEIEAAGNVRHLLMAVDGSERAEHGLAQVRALGTAIGADVEPVEIREGDPVDGLVSRFAYGDHVLGCIATHGRDRSGVLVGSVAHDVLERLDEPMLLIGPSSVWTDDPEAPVVAAVDGSSGDASVAGVAAGWAKRMHRHLHLITVAASAPEPVSDAAPRRLHGPDRPAEHLETLARYVRGHGVDATLAVLDDPVLIAEPVVDECERLGANLVVVGAHRHHGLHKLVLGSHAARIVHRSSAPVLVVPLGLRA